jgi:hypothetical protein
MITLIKDESHKGYYKDEDDNLYVFRFGGRPIKVDSYRDDLPNEKIKAEEIVINENDVITHSKEKDDMDFDKLRKLEIINETNPMFDDYHTGIRKVDDIKTWEEVLKLDDESEGQFAWGDYSREDAEKALENNTIKIYSSNPIENGVFVSTSYIQAEEYAGGKGNQVYSKEVSLNDVAWINGDEGQFAKYNSKLDNKYTNYDNTSRDGNEQTEYYDKIGKEKFNEPSNMYLDRYIKYGQQKIDDSDVKLISSNIKELSTPAKEDFIVYHGKDNNDININDKTILSTSLNKQVSKSYAKLKNENVMEIRINKDAPIISTYNAKDLSDEEHHHFKNQSEIVLLPAQGNLIEIAPGVYEFKKNEQ